MLEITRQGTHPDTAYTEKKNMLYIAGLNHLQLSRKLRAKVQKNLHISK
jgi:hypothetical protein